MCDPQVIRRCPERECIGGCDLEKKRERERVLRCPLVHFRIDEVAETSDDPTGTCRFLTVMV